MNRVALTALPFGVIAGLLLASVVMPSMSRAQLYEPNPGLAFERQLDIGARGFDVAVLQAYLAGDPTLYPQGLVTGYYGPLTKAAVARWQTRHDIPPVGRVGPITMAFLNKETEVLSLAVR